MGVGPGGAALYRTETTVDRKVSIFGSGGASTKNTPKPEKVTCTGSRIQRESC